MELDRETELPELAEEPAGRLYVAEDLPEDELVRETELPEDERAAEPLVLRDAELPETPVLRAAELDLVTELPEDALVAEPPVLLEAELSALRAAELDLVTELLEDARVAEPPALLEAELSALRAVELDRVTDVRATRVIPELSARVSARDADEDVAIRVAPEAVVAFLVGADVDAPASALLAGETAAVIEDEPARLDDELDEVPANVPRAPMFTGPPPPGPKRNPSWCG